MIGGVFVFGLKDIKNVLESTGNWSQVLKDLENETIQLGSDNDVESDLCEYINGYIDGIKFSQRRISEVFKVGV